MKTVNTRNLFNEVRAFGRVAPPCRHVNSPIFADSESKISQDFRHLFVREFKPCQAFIERRVKFDRWRRHGYISRNHNVTGLSAANIKNHLCRKLHSAHQKTCIDTTLKAVFSIAINAQALGRAANGKRVKIGRLD